MTRIRLFLPVVAAGALVLGGCGAKRLNTDKLEGKIKQGIEQQARVKVKKVDCPSDVKVKQGDVFTCTAVTATGQKARITVTQRDDKGNVNYSVGA